jgi:hypothetical protein
MERRLKGRIDPAESTKEIKESKLIGAKFCPRGIILGHIAKFFSQS